MKGKKDEPFFKDDGCRSKPLGVWKSRRSFLCYSVVTRPDKCASVFDKFIRGAVVKYIYGRSSVSVGDDI